MNRTVVLNGKTYTLEEKLGKGAFGEVYKASLTVGRKKEYVAIKIIKALSRDKVNEIEGEFSLMQEIMAVKPHCHPGILCYRDVAVVSSAPPPTFFGNVYLITNFIDGYDLGKYLACEIEIKKRAPSTDKIVRFMKYMINAVKYIHSKGLAHRDIKPENIMYNDKRLTLIDFGLLCSVQDSKHPHACRSFAGTPFYMAPELLELMRKTPTPPKDVTLETTRIVCQEGETIPSGACPKVSDDYYRAGDIWALGVIFYELAHADWMYTRSVKTVDELLPLARSPKKASKPTTEIAAIINSCLTVDYRRRPTVEQLSKM